jgi:hypothetical protein
MNKIQMINEILLVAKANELYVGGDIFFALVFKTESELVDICKNLHVSVKKPAVSGCRSI